MCWMICEVFANTGLSRISPEYFLGQTWPDLWPEMDNMCYCHEFNDMLNMLNYVIKMEIIICIGLYD